MSLTGSTQSPYPDHNTYGKGSNRVRGNMSNPRSFIELGDRSKHSVHSEVDLVPRNYAGKADGMGTRTVVESTDVEHEMSSDEGDVGIIVTTNVARIQEDR